MNKIEKTSWITFIILFIITIVLVLVFENDNIDYNAQKALIFSNQQQTTNTLLLYTFPSLYK